MNTHTVGRHQSSSLLTHKGIITVSTGKCFTIHLQKWPSGRSPILCLRENLHITHKIYTHSTIDNLHRLHYLLNFNKTNIRHQIYSLEGSLDILHRY